MEQIENTMFSEYSDVVSVNELTSMLHIGKNKAYELLNTNTIQSIILNTNKTIDKKSAQKSYIQIFA